MTTLVYRYVFLMFASITIVNSRNPKVSTKFGEIVGNEITVNLTVPLLLPNTKVQRYLGIPFAKPPVGDLRFRKPEPVTSLPSPFYAQNFSAICPQRPALDVTNASQSEDCLYLNVYVPYRPAEIPGGHAVMIWIYGGAFREGAGSHYDFSTLSVTGNIIVVTFNYRLGVFGFLSSGDENARGNYGLWDQHMVFQWVHDNIGDFGGNSERVTIAGQSAGAMSVIQHALVPANKGLFQRIIAQSGSMSMPLLDLEKDRVKDIHVYAESVGCKRKYTFDIMECLRTKSVDDLLAQPHVFEPMLDGELIKVNTRDIAKLVETRTLDEVNFFRSLDILSGFNANEGVLFLPMINYFLPKELQFTKLGQALTLEEELSTLKDLSFGYNDWRKHYLPAVMNIHFRKHFPDEIIQLVETQYTPWSAPYDHHLLRLQFEKLVGDLSFAIPAIEMAQLHAMSSSSSKNNFMYYFAPKPSIRVLPTPSWIPGAGHGDETMFMMGAFGKLGVGEENAWENDLMTKMVTYWSNFVKSGNPNYPEGITPFWSKYDIDIGKYLLLNKTMTDMPGPRYFYAEEANFWLHVFPDLVASKGNCTDGSLTSAASTCNLVLNSTALFTILMFLCIVSHF